MIKLPEKSDYQLKIGEDGVLLLLSAADTWSWGKDTL